MLILTRVLEDRDHGTGDGRNEPPRIAQPAIAWPAGPDAGSRLLPSLIAGVDSKQALTHLKRREDSDDVQRDLTARIRQGQANFHSKKILEHRQVLITRKRDALKLSGHFFRQPAVAAVEERLRLVAVLRLCEQIALCVVASEIPQHHQLRCRLDTLGDDAHLQVLRERDDRLENLRILNVRPPELECGGAPRERRESPFCTQNVAPALLPK
jgi:hypothetical protein